MGLSWPHASGAAPAPQQHRLCAHTCMHMHAHVRIHSKMASPRACTAGASHGGHSGTAQCHPHHLHADPPEDGWVGRGPGAVTGGPGHHKPGLAQLPATSALSIPPGFVFHTMTCQNLEHSNISSPVPRMSQGCVSIVKHLQNLKSPLERAGVGRRCGKAAGRTCRSCLEETHLVTPHLTSVTHGKHGDCHPQPSSTTHPPGVTCQALHPSERVLPQAEASPASLPPLHCRTWLPGE